MDTNKTIILLISLIQLLLICCQKEAIRNSPDKWDFLSNMKEYQLTDTNKGHFLGPTQNFSPDDNWIVYDNRNDGAHMGRNCCIEVVDINTGEEKLVYRTKNQTLYGPGVGTATFNPIAERIVFIRGIQNSNEMRPYGFTRRTGVAVDIEYPNVPMYMDARDIIPPFTPGALRGGTHAHTWSGDGEWISFTYNDDIMANLSYEKDIRVVGVMAPFGPVLVSEDSLGENNNGQKFSVVVTRVTAEPEPGSDEISRAYEDGWVGNNGYLRKDGTRQKRAIAFLGDVKTTTGDTITEVFIVNIPNDPTIAEEGKPIEGTASLRPMPPAGTKQHRLTYTDNRKYPGVQGPRHWMRSTPDGSMIFFLMRDDDGYVQFFSISSNGEALKQITKNRFSVETSFNVSPHGKFLTYGGQKHVYATHIASGETKRLTSDIKSQWSGPSSVSWSRDGRKIAYNREVAVRDTSYYQIFMLEQAEKK